MWWLCWVLQTLGVPDSLHLAVVHGRGGGSGFVIAFKVVFAHSKSWPSHPASSRGGIRTSAAAKEQLSIL